VYSKVMVAYDGTVCAELALREAARLALNGAQLLVVTVAEHPRPLRRAPDQEPCQAEAAALNKARVLLEQALRRLAALGVEAADTLVVDQTELPDSSVARALLDEARNSSIDLVIMGTHGRSGFRRFLLGSVAERVVRESACPVLLVRGDNPAIFSCLNAAEIYGQWPENEKLPR
jgi:nucleotide-binding universal stress UspA family protein